MTVMNLNNEAAALIGRGELDAATAVLDRAEAQLAARPPPRVAAADLDPAFDEYFYRIHRAVIGWTRGRHAEALPHARRAWELEKAIVGAARGHVRDLSKVGFSTGAWAAISVLTACRQFDEAAAVFGEVIADAEWFAARHRRDRAAAQKILVAGLCVYFERREPAWLARGRAQVRRAEELISADHAELVYGYACYWALVGDPERAFAALRRAVDLKYPAEKMLADDDLASLRADPRFEDVVTRHVLTWRLRSDPPGARIWLDGADTGLTTPARLRPPARGRARVRLVLDGHEPYEDAVRARGGLDLGVHLTSLAARAADERADADAERAPDADARARTRALLGDRRRAWVRATRHTTYGLGGLAITIHGDGAASLVKQAFGAHERAFEHAVTLPAAEVARVFDAFVDEAFPELVVADRPGVPDELYVTLELGTPTATHARGKFASNRHARFERLVDLVREVVGAHVPAALRGA